MKIRLSLKLAFLIFFCASSVFAAEVSNEEYDDIALFGRVMNFVQKQYADKVDTKKLVYGAIKGMLESLDPHSNFLPPEIYKQLKADTSGKFGGVGIEVWIGSDGLLTVVNPLEETPAWKAGIKSGDKIIKINGKATKGMSLSEVNQMIRGESGTSVKLTIARATSPKPLLFKLTRVSIKLDAVKSADLGNGFGYIRIVQFQDRVGRDTAEAIAKLEKNGKLKGLILDLRNNPGGLLEEAVDTVNLFVDSGVIVSTRGRNKDDNEVRVAKSGIARLDFPMVVLINGSSASAAEIVAGALKDHKRATIAGRRSFGKGSVQTVIPLSSDAGLKLTIARYYTPNGTSIQAKGIQPDVVLSEFDPHDLSKKKKVALITEASLKNHFSNEEGAETATDETRYVEVSDDPPKPLDPHTDYQVQQAKLLLANRGAIQAKTNVHKP